MNSTRNGTTISSYADRVSAFIACICEQVRNQRRVEKLSGRWKASLVCVIGPEGARLLNFAFRNAGTFDVVVTIPNVHFGRAFGFSNECPQVCGMYVWQDPLFDDAADGPFAPLPRIRFMYEALLPCNEAAALRLFKQHLSRTS